MAQSPLTGLSQFAARAFVRRGARRSVGDDLVALAPSLRPADGQFLDEWRDDRFALAGHSVRLGGRMPFEILDAPLEWLDALHGFSWLRHLPADATGDDGERIAAIAASWLDAKSRRSTRAISEAVRARRVISWLAHADVLLGGAPASVYDDIMAQLTADLDGLERQWKAIDRPAGRLLALIAVAQAGLCLEGAHLFRSEAERGLAHELSERRRPALVPLLRDPDALANLMLDFEALRRLYSLCGIEAPTFLQSSLADITASFSTLLLGDDILVRLGTPRATAEQRLTVAAVRRHAALPSVGSRYDEHSGAVRLALQETCVIVDVGAPLGSRTALAMEMSSGDAPLLVHDGMAPTADNRGFQPVGAAPEAEFGVNPARPLPSRDAPYTVTVDLGGPSQRVDATRAAPGLPMHRRIVVLDAGGACVTGIDELRSQTGLSTLAGRTIVVRFHLHPSVLAGLGAAADRVELTLPNGHRWRLHVPQARIAVDPALYRDGLRTLPSLQITATPAHTGALTVTWHLERSDGMSAAV